MHTVIIGMSILTISSALSPRATLDKSQASAPVDDEDADDAALSGTELVMSKFSFMPMNRMYCYPSGGTVSRTVVVAEINLPPGVGPKMWEVRVSDGGAVLELDCEWPDYMLNPTKFNGKWLSGTGDGSMGPNDSSLTHSMKNAQDIVKEYGERAVKSTARLILPVSVEESVESIETIPLGFLDPNDAPVKANGCALKVRMLAQEEIPITLYNTRGSAGFDAVKPPAATIAATAPGSALSGL